MALETTPINCWAHAVSECGEPLSAPLATLCSKHHAALSPLDRALLDLDNAMREVQRLRDVRKGLNSAWTPVRLTVDGTSIERAALKLALEFAVSRGLEDWSPPAWLPAAIFGLRELPEGCGVALAVRVGDDIFESERIGISLAKSDRTGRYECVVLQLREKWKLLCTWDKPIAALGTLHFGNQTYVAGEDTRFHPRRVSYRNHDEDLAVSLDFDWSGHWSPKKYPNVAKLRK
ncbi:MAG TPA: hypothetical protein VGC79_33420 [Polyangiaceae bacterium]